MTIAQAVAKARRELKKLLVQAMKKNRERFITLSNNERSQVFDDLREMK